MKNKITLLFLIFLLTNSLFSQNLILNGGFEIGGSGVGFVTNGAGYTLLNAPYSGTTATGNFAFTTNPNLINTTSFIPSSDHTSGNGRMLIIDGNTTTGNPRFWRAGNTGAGITTLTIGTTYRFSYWIKSVSSLVTGPTSQADIGVQITGGTATLVSGSTLAPLPALGWRHVVYSFTATATTATIELWNNNISASGNDFAVDDFMLTDDLMVTYNVTDALCATANDGSITVTGLGGTLPYTNYTITGPVTQNNGTGVFVGIPPGIYTVSVRDSALPTAVTVTMVNAVVGPSLTITPSSSAVCLGSPTTLTASGGSNSYTWTATPAATAGLTTPSVANPTVIPTAAVSHTYTASSTIGACTVTKPLTITVNPLPIANFTGNATICPGNTAVITFTGTPNSNVTFVNNLGNTYVRSIPASGTITWTTPVLNATTVYTLQNVKISASPFCQTNYPVGTAATVTITVVPNGCATVETVPAPGTLPLDLTLCSPGECRTFQANITPVPSTTSYSVTSIPFCPQAAFENPSWINIGPGSTFGDDDWSDGFSFPAGMNFCFYGQNYSQLNVGTNGVIRFPNPNLFIGGDNCPWSYNQTIPNAGFPITNAIFGVYQDIDFSVTPPAGVQISVNYEVVGSYPCRKFIANFTNVPQFSCDNTIGLSTSQIVLYEVSNIIEVYVQRRTACTGWNGGRGTIGIINSTGLQAVAAPGRNAAPFSTDPTPNNSTNTDNASEAWRFTPTGPNVLQTINWYQGPASPANLIGTGSTIQVCPAVTTNYTLESVYDVCGVPQKATSPITLNVNSDLTNAPVNITQCTNTFDLTSNTSVILGALNPADYLISYHLTAAEAANRSNSITNPNIFVSSGQTIYTAINVRAVGCNIVKQFNLIISCGTISPVPDLSLCESSLGSGTARFDLTPQTAIALGAVTPSDYTITYYLTQAAADAGISGTEINPINSFLSANQTIYIRMQEVADPSIFFTTNFDLIVNPLPTITGPSIVCEGSSISLSGSGSSASTNPWVSSNPLIATITNLGLISGVSSGTTTITYTNSNGCQNSVDVVVNPLPTVVGLSNICLGSTTQLTGSPIAAILNPWVSSDGSVVTITNSGLVTSITAGTTSIIYTNTFGCKKVVSITVDPLPTVTGTLTVCSGLTTQLSGTGTPATVDPWVSSDTLIATITSSGLVTGVSIGTTTITYTTSTGCKRTATIIVNGLPTITGTLNVCKGLTTQLTGSVIPAATNPWVSSNPLVATINNSGLVTGLSAGTTTITYTNSNGCQVTATVIVNALPTITGNLSVCIGLTTQLTGSVTPATTNPWVSSNTSVATIDTTGLVTSISVGTTTITYTNSNGCKETAIITVNDLPTITGDLSVCVGLTTQLTGSATSATNNAWVSSNPLVATINNSGLVTGVSDGSTTITYTNSNGCKKTAIVTVNSLPTIIGNLFVCVGLTTQLTGSATPATTNAWVSSNPLVATINNSGLVTGVSAGSSTITYTNSNGCQVPATVIVNAIPTITGNLGVCIGLTTQLTGNATPATTNPWVSSNTSVATIDTTGLVTSISVGTTTITYTNSNGCKETAIITVNDLPTITGDLIVCVGLTTQLTGSATPATTNAWVSSNPLVGTINNSGLVTGVSAGSTTITYTNSNGCKITDTITVNALPTITGNLGVCIGLTTQLTGSVTPATTNPWFSSNTSVATIDTTGLVTSISVGTTTITYTNSNGCQKNTLVTVNPLPAVIVPATLFECSNGTVTTATFDLTINQGVVTGGLPGFSVTYYTSLTNALNGTSSIVSPTSYTGLDNEDVYLRVENTATGCFSITTQLLRVTNGPLAITPLPLHYCDPNNDGFGVFDLDSTINEIAGGPLPTGVLVTFHETQTDALIGANPYPSPYANLNVNTQTIYVRVFYTLTGCANYVELQLIVDPTPIATEPDDYELCDSTGAVGFESFDLTTTNPQILGSLNPLIHAVTFYTNQAAAELGTGNITNPTNYSSNTQIIYVRVENTLTGCYDIVTLQLIVNPPPNSTQPNYAQYSLCDYNQTNIGFETFDLASQVASILLGQTGMDVTFYPSLAEAQNGTGAITNLQYTNAVIYVQTLGIRITNTTTGCYVISTMDIRVEPLPTLIPPASYTLCDDNQDGFSCDFDLTTLEADILQGVAYNLSFYETRTGAEIGDPVTAIDTTVPYCNLLPFTQTLWVRAEDPFTGCWSIMPIELNVDPSPVAPLNLNPITVCDQDSNPLSASTLVNLTQQTAAVLAQQTGAATNYTVTYYTSKLLAEQGTAPIIPATNYLASNIETIWVRVENNATGCYNLGSFQVFVGIPLVVPTPQPINECDTLPNDQFAVFDLTVRQITALPGYTFQYYPSWTDAQNNTNQITNITSYTNVSLAVQTLGVRIISAQGCVGYTTLNIRVLPAPEPNTNPTVLPAVCEDSTTPGQATIDLTQNESYILNGDPNLSVQYYPTLTDLENDTNQITNPASVLVGDATLVDDPINLVQYVYIAVSGNNTIDHTGRRCYTVVPQGYVINPLPRVDIIGTSNVYQICESDPTGNDNIEIFDLTSQIPDLLEGNVTTPISTYSVAFYETATGSPITNPSAYTNTSSPQPIYVVINNTTTGCSSAVGSFTLQVNPKPVFAIDITTDLNYETCDENDGINDGQTLHNGLPLSDYIDDILGTTQSPADYTVTFHYNSQADAAAGLNAIQDLVTYQLQTGTYWVRIENNLTGCYITDSFAVIVEQLAEPNIVASTNIACVNFGETTVNNTLILDSQVTGNYTFEWYTGGNLIPGENGPTLTVTEVTDAQVEFSVIAISNSALQCASDTAPDRTRFTVIRSGLASNLTYTVTNAFSDLQIITVTNDGYGVYHYSLDDGPILDNGGVFTNVPIGKHTVHVWDVRDPNGYSCGEVSIEDLQIIDYPHYFTPNGDGIHDTWNIVGLAGQPEAKIFIFDRYGKLLKQISSTGAGWDGTYNGYRMPSDDYWFTVDYEENGIMKQYKSHFAMKR